ncbi:MAG: YHS domain protein [Gammaproteobacteria bacterium]|nr:YHS domain protein [Gammaproteobacteria bacterium]MDH5801448.1 YHS domain protein [Gammaproteobacteria bacterium]
MKSILRCLLSICIFHGVAAIAADGVRDIHKSRGGIAIDGYDVTAYFTQQKPLKGSEKFQFQWGGAIWLFVDADALRMFKSNPEQYAPQYGGYCSNGLADGHKIGADPNNWSIIDGKLYLYFSQYGREQWQGKVKPLMESADETWQTLKQE